ncbi:MAG: outer membrane beta-barrel protein, partial [Parafilimonas sp.]
IKMPVLNNLNEYNNDKNLEASIYLTTQNLLNNELGLKEKSGAEKTASVVIKLPKKHAIVISPFFSFDHISGRFIEQYEFDNETKNDYSKREKPDVSFTGGILAAYQLNHKFSLLSGVSLSNSKISISSTAVNALKDATGVYKFKLATSYGLAEISNSGIIPTEGDSLLISSASMQFNYVSFPVLVSYNLNSKKIKLSVHSGLILNKLTSEKVETDYHVQSGDEAETINKIEGIRKTFFTLNAGIEAGYTITPHLNISVSPELRYGVNSINKQTPIKTYPINYGIALHVDIHL